MAHADKSTGVAPRAEFVTFASGTYTPSGTCIGFYVGGTAGNVVFQSGPNTITLPVLANTQHSWEVLTITQSGTTATSLWAMII